MSKNVNKTLRDKSSKYKNTEILPKTGISYKNQRENTIWPWLIILIILERVTLNSFYSKGWLIDGITQHIKTLAGAYPFSKTDFKRTKLVLK